MQQREFVLDFYQDIKSAWGGRVKTRDEKRRESTAKNVSSKPFGAGRDPHSLENILQSLISKQGWAKQFAESDIITNWADLVGVNVAQRARILSLEQGVLVLQAASQTWTTELRRQRETMLLTINERYPAAKIREIKIEPPATVNWRHGPYSVRGRGPRDTYDWA